MQADSSTTHLAATCSVCALGREARDPCPLHVAAPDLLAVLERMTPDYEHCAPDERGDIDPDRVALIARARAAIAAAKGEPS